MPKLLAVVGPTASGKSDFVLDLAKKHGAHIISCDSLLIYREMDIGTAKPSEQELQLAPHHGINLVNPDQTFNAGDYVKYVRPILDDLVKKNTPTIIVGGTGFYLKALICGIWDAPPTNLEIRQQLENEVAHLSHEKKGQYWHEKLKSLDPIHAPKIEPNDHYRLIRALEIITITGKSVTELTQNKKMQNPLPYPCPVFGLTRKKPDLERRIIERTNKMFEKGLIKEVKALTEKFGQTPPKPLHSVGYAEVLDFFAGKMTLSECRERIVISTRQLAKKQMTFFRGMELEIDWHELPSQSESLSSKADNILSGA